MSKLRYKYFKDTPISDWLKEHPAINLNQIARDMKCSSSYLRGIVRNEKYITAEMEAKITKAFKWYGYDT